MPFYTASLVPFVHAVCTILCLVRSFLLSFQVIFSHFIQQPLFVHFHQVSFLSCSFCVYISLCKARTWPNLRLSMFMLIASMWRKSLCADMESGRRVRNWARWMKSMFNSISSYMARIPTIRQKHAVNNVLYTWCWCVYPRRFSQIFVYDGPALQRVRLLQASGYHE